jgi:hypothetical protein
MRRRPLPSAIAIAVVLAPLVAACGGGDDGDDDKATDPPASQTPFGGGDSTPPATPGRLPPEFVKCMADRGIDVKSSADIHSAPPQVLQACFGALHQGGG